MNTSRRRYDMTIRAATAEATRAAILRATLALASEKSTLDFVLAEVATRAGVTVKTLLRHFGSRDGLLDALFEFGRDAIRDEREAPVGDVVAAVAAIVEHYEQRGDLVIGMLAQEATDQRIATMVAEGRGVHRRWAQATFAPQLDTIAEEDGTVDLLVLATDVYTWKLLRRDMGLDRATTERRMARLVAGVLGPRE